MHRRINQTGLEAIKRFEGLRLNAYLDSVGVPTIGYGHTKTALMGQVITAAKAEELLRDDLADAERAVEKYVKVPLNENQFAALVSFVFNLGSGTLQKSTLLKKLNAGDYDAVPREMMRFINAGGKPLKGLVTRRAAEAGLWAKGSFVASKDVQPEPPKPMTQSTTIWAQIGAILTTVGSGVAQVFGAIDWKVAAVLTTGAVLAFGIWTINERLKHAQRGV
jgi:lysozyme